MRLAIVLLAGTLAGAPALVAQSSPPRGLDGALAARVPCAPMPPYAAERSARAAQPRAPVAALPDSGEFARLTWQFERGRPSARRR